MRVVVFGAGALGLWFGYKLCSVASVVCVSRKRIKDALDSNCLVVKKGENFFRKRIQVETSLDNINKPDLVLLATKSYDSEGALRLIKDRWNEIDIITIQNGIYTEDIAKGIFSEKNIFPSTVMIGSRFINDFTIEEFLNDGMKIGSLTDDARLETIYNLFRDAGIKIEKSDNIMRDKWYKFMFYCSSATLNALTGTLDLSFGHAKWIIEESLKEIVEVAKHLDLDFSPKEVAEDVLKFSQSFKPKAWRASVGEDLRKGKNTEIDYLNGYIVHLGKRYNIETKVNQTLYRLVKMLEKTKMFQEMKEKG